MGVFSPEEYTHAKPKTAFFHMGVFIATVFGLSGVVYMVYPDKPAVPRTFADNGLETALGGKRALAVSYLQSIQLIVLSLHFFCTFNHLLPFNFHLFLKS